MNEGILIKCPVCRDKKPVLGRLLESGEFLVLRFHHGTTVVSSSEFSVMCGCGYTVHISHGSVVTNQITTV